MVPFGLPSPGCPGSVREVGRERLAWTGNEGDLCPWNGAAELDSAQVIDRTKACLFVDVAQPTEGTNLVFKFDAIWRGLPVRVQSRV